jgi:hypothetical protein
MPWKLEFNRHLQPLQNLQDNTRLVVILYVPRAIIWRNAGLGYEIVATLTSRHCAVTRMSYRG